MLHLLISTQRASPLWFFAEEQKNKTVHCFRICLNMFVYHAHSSSFSSRVRHPSHWASDFPCGQRSGCQAPQLALAGMLMCTHLAVFFMLSLMLPPGSASGYRMSNAVAVEYPAINEVLSSLKSGIYNIHLKKDSQLLWIYFLSSLFFRSLCSMKRMVSGGTLVEDLWLLPTGSWLLHIASSTSSWGE